MAWLSRNFKSADDKHARAEKTPITACYTLSNQNHEFAAAIEICHHGGEVPSSWGQSTQAKIFFHADRYLRSTP